MSFTPRYLGDTRGWACTFNTDTGTFSVASATLLMHYVDQASSVHTVGTGSWSNVSGNTATYTPANTDAVQTTAGIYEWYPTANGIPMDKQIIEIIDPTRS